MGKPYCHEKCAFKRRMSSGTQVKLICAYCLITGKPRGCSAGSQCVHKCTKIPLEYKNSFNNDSILSRDDNDVAMKNITAERHYRIAKRMRGQQNG